MSAVAAKVPTYLLYGENAEKGPDFWFHVETIESRSKLHAFEIRRHRHDIFFQILFLQHGQCDVVLDEETWTIQPPCLILMPQGHNHGFRFSPDVEGYVMTLLSARLPEVQNRVSRLHRLYQKPMRFECADGDKDFDFIRETLLFALRDVASDRLGSQELAFAAIAMILILLERKLPADGLQTKAQLSLAAKFERLQWLVQQSFRQHLPVSHYAEEIGVSVTHLNRIARQASGRSVGELLADAWLQEARRHLVFTALSVKQIAFDLGFADPAYFSRFFTRETGVSPRDYRAREREGLKDQIF